MKLEGGELHPTPRLSRDAVLVWAASRGYIRLVKNILSVQEMGPWINTPILSSGHGTSLGSFGMTPIHAAAKGGHADIVDLLIEYGADVDATVAGNLRPIHFANNEDVVMALVRHGSSIHSQGKSTVPPLTYVLTTKPHLSAIQCLLRLGCNPNAAVMTRLILPFDSSSLSLVMRPLVKGNSQSTAHDGASTPRHAGKAHDCQSELPQTMIRYTH